MVVQWAAAQFGQAGVVYVNGVLTNLANPDGKTWSGAYAKVQQGLDAAADGDEVWVAKGTYFERVKLKSGVALFGGFAATESERSERRWVLNATILDGSSKGTVVIAPKGVTNTTRIDGFVVQHGAGTPGGGISCIDSSPVIANNTIALNTAVDWGHGIYCLHSGAVITNNLITGNFKSSGPQGVGGGIYDDSGSALILYNLIIGNQSSGGGGIALYQSNAEIAYNLIHGNYATSVSGGIDCYASAPSIHNNRITGNVVSGAIDLGGGGLGCWGGSSASVYDNLFLSNVATNKTGTAKGGAAFFQGSVSGTFFNNTLLGNVGDLGGGVYSAGTAGPAMVNNLIAFCSSGVVTTNNLEFRHNCVFGSGTSNFVGWPDPTGVEGNLSMDPRLIEDSEFGTAHLKSESPCRDAGDTSVVQADWLDINGGARIRGVAVDIGAEEFDESNPAMTSRIVRVAPDGDDAQDGLSWASAKRSVQAAIGFASAVGGEVWVKAGIYFEGIQLRPFTYVYGGFRGDELVRDRRDWEANVCVLDGAGLGSVVAADYIGMGAAIDGFTLRNGRALAGGGVRCLSASPSIRHNVITSNTAQDGGGVYAFDALRGGYPAPAIANNRIIGNTAAKDFPLGRGRGGGLYLQGSFATVANNAITGNIAQASQADGAAIHLISSQPAIVNNTILANVFDGGVGPLAAAISARTFSKITFVNNLVVSNSAGLSFDTSQNLDRLRHNCIFGNANYDFLTQTNLLGTNGNIALDPLLSADGLHLATGSPCVDAGDDTAVQPDWLDIEGEPRIQGSHVDIGASESLPPVLSTRFQNVGLTADGRLRFVVEGVPGVTYLLQKSSDLVGWDTVATNAGPSFEWTEPEPAVAPARFFRAKSQP